MHPLRIQLFSSVIVLFALFIVVTTYAQAGLSPSSSAGYVENDGDDRKILLTSILPDLKVFVDVDPNQLPYNSNGQPLTEGEVRQAVYLGIGNWASVLPDMHFHIVLSPDSANLVFRFRNYEGYIPGRSTAVAFLPQQWRPKRPAAGAFNFSCGAQVWGKLPSGLPCSETANNIILFQIRGLAFHGIDYLDAKMHYEYLASMTDRKDPRKRFFRFLPDAHYQRWPPDRTTCVSGVASNDSIPAWDVQCLADSDWAALKHYREFGREQGPYDISQMVQHEMGHTLLGSHTCESGRCLLLTGGAYVDLARDPVFKSEDAIRKAHWNQSTSGLDSSSFSILFNGNGLDASWNCRGVFEIDARWLASGSLDWNCAPTGNWHGYHTSYPKVNGWIVLCNRAGETKYLDDWHYAHRLMTWPLSSGKPVKVEWFQTGIILK